MKIGEIINWIGSFASIISLFLTLWVLWEIRKLTQFHVFVNRAPQLLVVIQKCEKDLSKLLVDFDNSHRNIKIKLGGLRGDLSSLQIMVDKSIRPSILSVIELIEQYNRNQPPDRERLADIQAGLRGVLREVENAVEYKKLVK
jgi:hypothetical protein